MANNGITICLVDDDHSVCKALRRLMSAAGFSVKTYGSAQEFLDTRQAFTETDVNENRSGYRACIRFGRGRTEWL